MNEWTSCSYILCIPTYFFSISFQIINHHSSLFCWEKNNSITLCYVVKTIRNNAYYVLRGISTPKYLHSKIIKMEWKTPVLKVGFMGSSTTNIINVTSWLYGLKTMTCIEANSIIRPSSCKLFRQLILRIVSELRWDHHKCHSG